MLETGLHSRVTSNLVEDCFLKITRDTFKRFKTTATPYILKLFLLLTHNLKLLSVSIHFLELFSDFSRFFQSFATFDVSMVFE